MRSVQRWLHYCDFCRRRLMSKPAMMKHEAHCGLNPARKCRVCSMIDVEQVPMPTLIAALTANGFAALRKEASNCPACILAAIRQATLPLDAEDKFAPKPGSWRADADEFKFKDEMAAVWSEINDARDADRPY